MTPLMKHEADVLTMILSMKRNGTCLCLWMSPPWLRGREGELYILLMSCTMARTNNCKPSKGIKENGGLDKHP